MDSKTLGLSRYELGARLAPALFTIAPAALLTAALAPNFWSLLSGLSAFILIGGSYLLMGVARQRGLAIEHQIEAELGGRPSTLALRHGHQFQVENRDRYHRVLRDLGMDVPTADEQRLSVSQADLKYKAAVTQLIGLTRDESRFAMLFGET